MTSNLVASHAGYRTCSVNTQKHIYLVGQKIHSGLAKKFIHSCPKSSFGWKWIVFGQPNISSVQSLSRVWLFVTPWTAAHQASLSITNSRSLLKLMSIELVMPSNHLILCRSLLLLPSIFPSIRVFSNESALRIRWPKYWSFSVNISPSNEHLGLISYRMDWLDLLDVSFHDGLSYDFFF